MNVVRLFKAVDTLARTGKPKEAQLPVITAEKLLWVLDNCYDGNVEKCHPAMIEVMQAAEQADKSVIRAIGHWADTKMDKTVAKTQLI